MAVGPGRIDDNGNRVPLDVAVGDKVHLPQVRRHRGQVRRRRVPRPVGPRRPRGRRPLARRRAIRDPDASASGPRRRLGARSPRDRRQRAGCRRDGRGAPVGVEAVGSCGDPPTARCPARTSARPAATGSASTRSPPTCSGGSCRSTSSRSRPTRAVRDRRLAHPALARRSARSCSRSTRALARRSDRAAAAIGASCSRWALAGVPDLRQLAGVRLRRAHRATSSRRPSATSSTRSSRCSSACSCCASACARCSGRPSASAIVAVVVHRDRLRRSSRGSRSCSRSPSASTASSRSASGR